MRAVLVRSLAVLGIGGVLLAGVLYVASTVDARAPTVLGISVTQPLPDDVGRTLATTTVEVAFSEPVDQESAAAAISFDPAVEGAVSWSGSTLIFTPDAPLELDTEYVVSVTTGIRDLAGNAMTELPPAFSFATAGRPQVVLSDPADGAEAIGLDGSIAITFSTLMDTSSVEAALSLRPVFSHELQWSGELLEIVPAEPLDPDREYSVTVGADAADVSGVPLSEPFELSFHTLAPGLEVTTLVPRDSSDGIATISPIAVILDRPIDPASVADGLLEVTPDVAGSLDVATLPGEDPRDDGAGRVLRFVPSGPLPPNTTFQVQLLPGLSGLDGGSLAEPIDWRFTTGSPLSVLSNQITFLSDRGGIMNLWTMNPDGTGQRQLSVELAPVLDYAVAPDGSSYVVADGRHLTFARPDGSDRRVLTEDGLVEFDPAYAPDGELLVFGRADAETGEGLGLWEVAVTGGDATPIEPPDDGLASPAPTGADDGAGWLRAPRYSPDGQALTFVDAEGRVAVLELPSQRLTLAGYAAVAPPIWLADSSGVLLTGLAAGNAPPPPDPRAGPVLPLEPPAEGSLELALLNRSGTRATVTPFGDGAAAAAVAADDRIAFIRDGDLFIADGPDDRVVGRPVASDAVAAAFAPGPDALVAVVSPPDPGPDRGSRIELVDLGGEESTVLSNDGRQPRWLP
ncbi:MAG: Ig-like domain-containing protein [Candidatus Limnocylindria bacterium]